MSFVTIRLVGYLKERAGFKEKNFEIVGPTMIKDLVEFPKLPENRIVVLINEKGGSMDSTVDNGDMVKILPVVGGG